MRTFSAILLALGLGLTSAAGLDEPARPKPPVPMQKYSSARDAVRSGVRDYNAGDKAGAARALEYAAGQGHALALWKLGRMHAEGDGVPHDDLKAFGYFSRIADENADEGPDSPNAGVIASAFTALGAYFVEGIKGTYVKPNPARAHEMFHYSASYFGDPHAQYSLARLYLDGTGVERDPRQAARWLNLAAEKGHHQSQALLGRMLFTGQGVPRERAAGLMWLTLARDASEEPKDQWILDLYEESFAAASESDRQSALRALERFMKRRR